MEQTLDEARTLAIKLFEAAQDEKMRQPKENWGDGRLTNWRELPSATVAVWDAVAIRAYQLLKKQHVRKSEGADRLLELGQAKSNDAHCLACGFRMVGGRYVGLCPKCGSDRWHRTRLT